MTTKRFTEAGLPTPEALAQERQLQDRYPGYRGVDDAYVHTGIEALERWSDWKFGILGIGCWAYGGDQYGGAQAQEDVDAVVARAIEVGCNYFDTATAYN